jgi:hypothetical protein
MLLDILTVFFIVAGCVLLWLNLRPKRPRIALAKTDDFYPQSDLPVSGPTPPGPHQSAPSPHGLHNTEKHPLIDVLQHHLSEAKTNPESAAEDNAYANRVAAGIVKARKNAP